MTFIELIVVISIFSVIAGVVLFRSSDFGDSIALQNLAQDIALQIKTAQNNGSSGKFDQCFVTSGTKPSYGMYFDTGPSSNKQFAYFADFDGSGFYDYGATPACGNQQELQNTFAIGNNNSISGLCVNEKSGTNMHCGLNELHILFTRPNLNAAVISVPPWTVADAEIKITSPKGTSKTIVVWPTGQISVE